MLVGAVQNLSCLGVPMLQNNQILPKLTILQLD